MLHKSAQGFLDISNIKFGTFFTDICSEKTYLHIYLFLKYSVHSILYHKIYN